MAIQSRVKGHARVQLTKLDVFAFGNPRAMTPKMRKVLATSLTEFGIVEPIVVRKKGRRFEILNGHHRFAALTEAGAEEVDVTVIDCPDDAKAKALVLALNSISAEFDHDELVQYVDGFLEEGGDLDWFVDVTGFSAEELDQMANRGSEFLDGVDVGAAAGASSADGGAEPGAAPVPTAADGSVLGVGAAPGTEVGAGETAPTITVVVNHAQHDLYREAITHAKQELGRNPKTVDALMLILQRYKDSWAESS